jgi:Xaa-Pro aminopeptidase
MTTVHFPAPGFDPQRCVALMQEHQFNGILVTSPENVYYTTGYPAIPSAGNPILFTLRNVLPFYVFLDAQGQVTLFCWGGAAAGVDFDASQVITFPDAASAAQKLSEFLQRQALDSGNLGIEASCPYEAYQLAVEAFSISRIALADAIFRELRLIKSPQEIEFLKKSTAIVEQTVSELIARSHLGMSRSDLIHEAKYRMLKNGATGIGHVTISFGDSNPEVEIDEHLQKDRLVVLDLGALYKGYASDNRRLLFSGKVPEGMLALHATMCAIVDEVAENIIPGRTFNELYALATRLYSENKLNPFIPNVGHTIGLNTEEAWLYKDSPVVVQPGMAINLELYSLYQTGELIGDEETYWVSSSGANRLTTLPRTIKPIYS